MPLRLPEPLAAYFAAIDTHNIDAMLASFATVPSSGMRARSGAASRPSGSGWMKR